MASPLSENPAERSERSHFAVAATAPIDESATVAAEMEVAPGRSMLVGVYASPVVAFDLEHPHEVVNAIESQIQKRAPIGHFPLECVAASLSRDHQAILDITV